jgi:putative ABC transport system permease protein
LISFTTYQKSKEIGIRKVYGASVFSIVKLLTVDFLKLALLAAIIALPLAYWIIDGWLSTFAYRFEPMLWMYAVPLILLFLTSMLAVGGQTLRAAFKNPVEAIADE